MTDSQFDAPNGVSVSVQLLHRELLKLGYDAFIVAPGRTLPQERVIGLPSIPYPFLNEHRISFPKRLGSLPRFDIIHSHSPFCAGLFAAAIADKWKIPHVSTFHTNWDYFTHYLPGLSLIKSRVPVLDKWLRRFYSNCDQIIVPSRAASGMVEAIGILTPATRISTAVDMERLLPSSYPSDAWRPGKRRLLTVGRLGKEKSLDVVLRSLSLMRSTVPVHLAVAGSGPEVRPLIRLARSLDVVDDVTFLGTTKPATLGALYCAAELYVSSSPSETQGLAICEAQAHGLPVVALRDGGVAEFVEDSITGFLVDQPNPQLLAGRALELLLNAIKLAEFSEASRQRHANRTPAEMTNAVLNVYKEALYDCIALRPSRIVGGTWQSQDPKVIENAAASPGAEC